jgi:molybdopterin-guanine dinucleotide biosynthesis protein A
VAHQPVTGLLLVGGASVRFGSPKIHARIGGEMLAERAWRILGDAFDERIAIGKGDEELPFPVLADGVEERAAIHGLVAGLRAASNDVCVALPVDVPRITAEALRALGAACRDAAVTRRGPLPGAFRKSALPALTAGELSIRRAIADLDVAVVDLDDVLLVNVNEPEDLRRA